MEADSSGNTNDIVALVWDYIVQYSAVSLQTLWQVPVSNNFRKQTTDSKNK